MSVTVEGIRRLRRKLGLLTRVEHEAADREIKRALVAIEAGAKERVPVLTGRLRNSITHEIEPLQLSGRVGTNVEYAPFVEHGTRKMAARPYLFPAFEEHRPEFLRRLRSAIERANEDVAGGTG